MLNLRHAARQGLSIFPCAGSQRVVAGNAGIYTPKAAPRRFHRVAHAATRCFLFTGQLILTAILFGWGLAVIYVADSLINAPPPTERCFTNQLTRETECRSQVYWGSIQEVE